MGVRVFPHTACAFSLKQHGVVLPNNSRVTEHRKSFKKKAKK